MPTQFTKKRVHKSQFPSPKSASPGEIAKTPTTKQAPTQTGVGQYLTGALTQNKNKKFHLG